MRRRNVTPHTYRRSPSVTPKELRLIREAAIRKRLELAELAQRFAEAFGEEARLEGPDPLSQEAFEKSARALAMERGGHAILGRLGHGTLTPLSDVPVFPLESEDRRMQRLLDAISFNFEWPAQEIVRGTWLRRRNEVE